ncbi:MAG TPA: ABC transporter permease subunit [Clostridia bacterium]|nr:ABC transporter permease subunit [Clostridia bacterium]
MSSRPFRHARGRLVAGNALAYVALAVLCLIWLVPIAWLVIISFSKGVAGIPNYFWPKYGFTLQNYVKLFRDSGAASGFYFPRWFLNTLFVAICSCALTTAMTLSVAYAVSRMRFRLRKPYLNVALILGMFPGFMSMIAVYYLLKAVGLTDTLVALILVYSGGAGLGFYVAKGFFDAVPKEMDEAAMIDGATRSQIFWRITMPLSKPVVVYTILTSFLAPWADFIFVNMIMGPTAYKNYTVALGLFRMIDREHITTYFSMFCAGAVLVSIPIVALFISMQKFYVEGITGGSVKG